MNHPPDSGVTLQINSLAALERLLGGDNELTTSIRKSVAAAFARNYMVDLVRSEFANKEAELKRAVAEEVNKVCLQKTRESPTWSPSFELSPSMKEKIRTEVATQLTSVINAEVAKQGETIMAALREELEKLRARIPNLVAEKVTIKFNREVNEALDARLKELRALLPLDPPETRKINVP
ncbi:hypothetical protein EKK58_00950 [Candidatus Dependentiae bacterium]|nr:MAG: hypothetical protein EKK58_00950 [Candidatus Dependentiae bacterium]